MPFVLDASVTGAWVFDDEKSPVMEAILLALISESAVSPSLWPTEVANALLIGIRKGRVSREGALDFLDRLEKLPIYVEPTATVYRPLLASAIELGLTVYDATYLDLALELGIPLATKDKAMRAAAAKLGVPVLPHAIL